MMIDFSRAFKERSQYLWHIGCYASPVKSGANLLLPYQMTKFVHSVVILLLW